MNMRFNYLLMLSFLITISCFQNTITKSSQDTKNKKIYYQTFFTEGAQQVVAPESVHIGKAVEEPEIKEISRLEESQIGKLLPELEEIELLELEDLLGSLKEAHLQRLENKPQQKSKEEKSTSSSSSEEMQIESSKSIKVDKNL